jgi:hypothetical protein
VTRSPPLDDDLKESDGVWQPSDCGEGGRTPCKVALFASAVAFIFSTITFSSSSMYNATSLQVFMLMDEHAMAAPGGGAHRDSTRRDSDGGSSNSVLESEGDHENYAMACFGGATHGGDDGESRNGTDQSAT